MNTLITQNVSKYYGSGSTQVVALHDINLEIEKEEFVSIVGSSGSGKSTLMHILGGLDYPSDGKVIIDGTDISNLDRERLTIFRRKHIGFVFQNYNLVPILNVTDNILLPVILDKNKIDKEYLDYICKMLGISDKLNNLPNQLSGGQQQRVAIARAMISKPSILLMDEPTGNLDSSNSNEVIKLVKRTSKELKQTILIITHDNSIAQCANRVISMKDGEIIE